MDSESEPTFRIWPTDWKKTLSYVLMSIVVFVSVYIIFRLAGKHILSQNQVFNVILLVIFARIASSAILGELAFVDALLIITTMVLVVILLSLMVKYGGPAVAKVIQGEPDVLYENGIFNQEAMQRERIGTDEVYSQTRVAGLDFNNVKMITLEPDGHFGFLTKGVCR
ncbi:Hypothetical protein POVN_LOCUS284 [uncultured virus]|nr:Hypothetical protein POVN_LOCUS284 [uncultured virus]